MSSRRRVSWMFVVFLAAGMTGAAAQAADPLAGTWKVNVAKSTYNPGPAPKSSTHTFEISKDGSVKHTIDTVNAEGQATHTEVTAKFDGKDYGAGWPGQGDTCVQAD